jgi:hypothetical protein
MPPTRRRSHTQARLTLAWHPGVVSGQAQEDGTPIADRGLLGASADIADAKFACPSARIEVLRFDENHGSPGVSACAAPLVSACAAPLIRTPAERAMGLPSLVAAIVRQTSHRGGNNKKAPRAGPSSCTIVQREPISSSGCRQLPILRQYHRIDGVNDSVRRDQIRFHDTGCVDAHVR